MTDEERDEFECDCNLSINDIVVLNDNVGEKDEYGEQTFTVIDIYWSTIKEQPIAVVQNNTTGVIEEFKGFCMHQVKN